MIVRAQEQTLARAHAAGIPWVHGPTAADFLAFSGYTFTQTVPANVWLINHGLEDYPSVSVVDSAGTVVYGDLMYLDSNTLSIEFSAAFAGVAYLRR